MEDKKEMSNQDCHLARTMTAMKFPVIPRQPTIITQMEMYLEN